MQKRVDPNKVTSAEKVDTEMSEKTAEQSIATEVEENGDRIESDDGMETLETEEVMINLPQILGVLIEYPIFLIALQCPPS